MTPPPIPPTTPISHASYPGTPVANAVAVLAVVNSPSPTASATNIACRSRVRRGFSQNIASETDAATTRNGQFFSTVGGWMPSMTSRITPPPRAVVIPTTAAPNRSNRARSAAIAPDAAYTPIAIHWMTMMITSGRRGLEWSCADQIARPCDAATPCRAARSPTVADFPRSGSAPGDAVGTRWGYRGKSWRFSEARLPR